MIQNQRIQNNSKVSLLIKKYTKRKINNKIKQQTKPKLELVKTSLSNIMRQIPYTLRSQNTEQSTINDKSSTLSSSDYLLLTVSISYFLKTLQQQFFLKKYDNTNQYLK